MVNCLIDKKTLNDFCNDIVLSLKCQRTDFLQNCFQRCQEIIAAYKPAFPEDCAQLDFLFWLINHNYINMNNCLMCFCLSDKENREHSLSELKDRIIIHLGIDDVSQILWERFRNKFIEEVDSQS